MSLLDSLCEEDFESRVVKGSTQRNDWTLENGPFNDDYFESMPKNEWTLLDSRR